MFGLNDEDHQTQAASHQNDHDQPTSQDGSPFAAAYSSLNGATPAHSQPSGDMPEEDLLQLKTQALQSLAPLVGHLEQSPEEKFKTTMMLLQSTDNPDLIRDAYQAATQINNEKARAQALLDVINEINYFTQSKKS